LADFNLHARERGFANTGKLTGADEFFGRIASKSRKTAKSDLT
jgi:hypothetical protein